MTERERERGRERERRREKKKRDVEKRFFFFATPRFAPSNVLFFLLSSSSLPQKLLLTVVVPDLRDALDHVDPVAEDLGGGGILGKRAAVSMELIVKKKEGEVSDGLIQ